jgi:hypothetical protein
MKATAKFGLLGDLAKLIQRYPPAVFADLAIFLAKPENIAALLSILEVGESVGRQARITKSATSRVRRPRGPQGLQGFLSRLEKDEPEKARSLADIYYALTTKRILPTMREMRRFLRDNDLANIPTSSREKAIGPLVRRLAMLPFEEIRAIGESLKTSAHAVEQRSLEGWTDLILGKRGSQGTS